MAQRLRHAERPVPGRRGWVGEHLLVGNYFVRYWLVGRHNLLWWNDFRVGNLVRRYLVRGCFVRGGQRQRNVGEQRIRQWDVRQRVVWRQRKRLFRERRVWLFGKRVLGKWLDGQRQFR